MYTPVTMKPLNNRPINRITSVVFNEKLKLLTDGIKNQNIFTFINCLYIRKKFCYKNIDESSVIR